MEKRVKRGEKIRKEDQDVFLSCLERVSSETARKVYEDLCRIVCGEERKLVFRSLSSKEEVDKVRMWLDRGTVMEKVGDACDMEREKRKLHWRKGDEEKEEKRKAHVEKVSAIKEWSSFLSTVPSFKEDFLLFTKYCKVVDEDWKACLFLSDSELEKRDPQFWRGIMISPLSELEKKVLLFRLSSSRCCPLSRGLRERLERSLFLQLDKEES